MSSHQKTKKNQVYSKKQVSCQSLHRVFNDSSNTTVKMMFSANYLDSTRQLRQDMKNINNSNYQNPCQTTVTNNIIISRIFERIVVVSSE